jgi:hypothetical protein
MLNMISSVVSGKFAQKCKYGLDILGAKLDKNVVKDLKGATSDICRYGEEVGTAKFQTFKDGTKVLTNTNGVPRLITIHDGQVAVKEGGKIKVISDDAFIGTYQPVYRSGEHYRYGLDGMRNARVKSGTKSYIDVCDELIAKKDKQLSDTLKQNNIEVLEYEPAYCIGTYDQEFGKVKLKINGVEGEINHLSPYNQTAMKSVLKDILVDKKPVDAKHETFKFGAQFADKINEFASKTISK